MVRFFLVGIVVIVAAIVDPLVKWLLPKYKSSFRNGLVSLLFKLLPHDRMTCIKAGKTLGTMIYRFGIAKKVVATNIDIVYGDSMTAQEKDQLMRKIYQFMAGNIFEMFALRAYSNPQILEFVQYDCANEVAEITEFQKETGMIILAAHSGNLEIGCMALSGQLANIQVYATDQISVVGDYLEKLRTRFGAAIIKKSRNSVLKLLKAIKAKHIILLAADFDRSNASRFHPFFSKKATVSTGVYFFSQRQKKPVYLAYTYRDENYIHRINIRKVDIQESMSEDEIADILTEAYNRFLEEITLKHPEQQYFWFTKRWKCRPPGDNSVIYA